MSLSKEQILSSKDITTEAVDVPVWGGEVKVKLMTGLERDAFEQSITETKGGLVKQNLANIRAKLVVRTVVDDNGDRVFDDKDAAELGKKSSTAIITVFDVSAKLNGLSGEDVEELAKNSDPGQDDCSTSA